MTSLAEIIDRQLEENIVSLFQRFVFGKAVVQIHNMSCGAIGGCTFSLVLQQWTEEVKQSFDDALPVSTA